MPIDPRMLPQIPMVTVPKHLYEKMAFVCATMAESLKNITVAISPEWYNTIQKVKEVIKTSTEVVEEIERQIALGLKESKDEET